MSMLPPECSVLPQEIREQLEKLYDQCLSAEYWTEGKGNQSKVDRSLKNYLKRLQYFGVYETDEIQWITDLESAKAAHQASLRSTSLDDSREQAFQSLQDTASLYGRDKALHAVRQDIRARVLEMQHLFFTDQDCANAADDVSLAAAWKVVSDVQLEPSPFDPLLKIWSEGFWPIGPLAGKFVVYSPPQPEREQRRIKAQLHVAMDEAIAPPASGTEAAPETTPGVAPATPEPTTPENTAPRPTAPAGSPVSMPFTEESADQASAPSDAVVSAQMQIAQVTSKIQVNLPAGVDPNRQTLDFGSAGFQAEEIAEMAAKLSSQQAQTSPAQTPQPTQETSSTAPATAPEQSLPPATQESPPPADMPVTAPPQAMQPQQAPVPPPQPVQPQQAPAGQPQIMPPQQAVQAPTTPAQPVLPQQAPVAQPQIMPPQQAPATPPQAMPSQPAPVPPPQAMPPQQPIQAMQQPVVPAQPAMVQAPPPGQPMPMVPSGQPMPAQMAPMPHPGAALPGGMVPVPPGQPAPIPHGAEATMGVIPPGADAAMGMVPMAPAPVHHMNMMPPPGAMPPGMMTAYPGQVPVSPSSPGHPAMPMDPALMAQAPMAPPPGAQTDEATDDWDNPLATKQAALRAKPRFGMWLFVLFLLGGGGYAGWYLYNQSSGVLFEKATVLIQQKKWREAEPLLRRILQSEPNYPGLHRALGHVYFATKRDKEAFASYQRSAPKYPKDGLLQRNLGYLYLQRQEWSDAKRFLTLAAELRSTDPYVWMYLGTVQLHNKQFTAAAQSLRKATRLDPQLAPAWNDLGTALLRNALDTKLNAPPAPSPQPTAQVQELAQQAEKAFRKAIQLSSQTATYYRNLADAQVLQDKPEDAERSYLAATQRDASQPATYNNYAALLLKQNRFKDAAPLLVRAIALLRKRYQSETSAEIRSQLASAYYNSAIANEGLHQKPQAIQDYYRYTQLSPEDADGFCRLGKLLYAARKRQQALPIYRACLRLDPGNRKAKYMVRRLSR